MSSTKDLNNFDFVFDNDVLHIYLYLQRPIVVRLQEPEVFSNQLFLSLFWICLSCFGNIISIQKSEKVRYLNSEHSFLSLFLSFLFSLSFFLSLSLSFSLSFSLQLYLPLFISVSLSLSLILSLSLSLSLSLCLSLSLSR